MEAVEIAKQSAEEDTKVFTSRVLHSSRVCGHVFRPVELVNAYVQGLQ